MKFRGWVRKNKNLTKKSQTVSVRHYSKSYTKVNGQIPEPQIGLHIARVAEQRQRFVLFYCVTHSDCRDQVLFLC